MLFLAIETSGIRGSLALFEGSRCLEEVLFPEGLVHGREISVKLAEVLDTQRVRPRDLEGLAVSVGPGSYTGCRVGVTAAKTLGYALRIPLVAVSSLEVLAATALNSGNGNSFGRVATLLDGRRGFFYNALFSAEERSGPLRRWPVRRTPDQVGRLENVRALLTASTGTESAVSSPAAVSSTEGADDSTDTATWVCGDGANAVSEAFAGDPLRDSIVRAPQACDLPRARRLGDLVWKQLEAAAYDLEALHSLEPSYLRPSEPELLLAQKSRLAGEK